MKKKVCAYVRVSSSSKAQEHSYEFQKAYWTEELSSNNEYDFVGVYADKGSSGKESSRRPQFIKMLTAAKNGQIDIIFCKSVQRFARNTSELLDHVRKLREYGVNFAETFPNCNIYVTGHSLGGYLAQIGGAAILESPYKNNVNEIGYFNGMGLYFWSNTRDYLYEAKLISKETYNILTNPCTPYNYTQSSAQSTLTNWYNNGGKLVSYYIKGDVISSLGTHYGKKIGFNPAQACINHHKHTDISLENRHLNNLYKSLNNLKNRLNLNILQKDGVDLIDKITHFASELLFNNNLSSYVDLYSPDTLIGYIWITHETDSFFAVEEEKLDIHFNTPSTIKNRKCSTATLIVETGTSELISSKLTTSNISLSSLGNRRIQIISISDPVHSQDENGNNTYTYTINLKGKALIGNTRLILNANSLKTNTNSNIRIVSNYIRTKLI